jgi:glutaconate CoA-transferase subunit A
MPPLDGKLMSAAEAVKRFIRPGSQIALGGFTLNRNPMHLAREIIRQNVRNLHLAAHSHGQALDMLIGAGCVDRLENRLFRHRTVCADMYLFPAFLRAGTPGS